MSAAFFILLLGNDLNPKYLCWKHKKISFKLQTLSSFSNSNRIELDLVAELAFLLLFGSVLELLIYYFQNFLNLKNHEKKIT